MLASFLMGMLLGLILFVAYLIGTVVLSFLLGIDEISPAWPIILPIAIPAWFIGVIYDLVVPIDEQR